MDDYNYIVDDMTHRIRRLYDAITDSQIDIYYSQRLRASQPLPSPYVRRKEDVLYKSIAFNYLPLQNSKYELCNIDLFV